MSFFYNNEDFKIFVSNLLCYKILNYVENKSVSSYDLITYVLLNFLIYKIIKNYFLNRLVLI